VPHHNRYKQSTKVPSKSLTRLGCWNVTGLQESAKIHTIIRHMKNNNIHIMVLTETHLNTPTTFMIEGYSVFHSADSDRDDQGKLKKTFTGVTLITSPKYTPTLTDLRPLHGRLLTATFNTAEAPLHLIAGYAPPNPHSEAARQAFFTEVDSLVQQTPPSTLTVLLGDFNAQVSPDMAQDPHVTGSYHLPHIPDQLEEGEQAEDPDDIDPSHKTTDNSSMLHAVCKAHKLCFPQTWMKKSPEQVHTHRRPNGDLVQLDHFITPQAWQGSILNITTNTTASLASNHYLIQATLRVKRGSNPQSKRPPPFFRHPNKDQTKAFNAQFASHHQEPQEAPTTQEGIDSQWKHIASNLTTAANQAIPPQAKHAKQPWITEATWKLIEQRDQAKISSRPEEEAQLHKQIRKQAKKDKTQWLKDQVEVSAKAPSAKEKWVWIKRLRKDFTGKSVALRDSQGKVVNTMQQAETFAQYLENKHWSTPLTDYTGPTTPITGPNPVNMDPITVPELNKTLRKVKNGKATGPDTIPAEFFKWLTEPNKQHLLSLFNNILLTGITPTEWHMANVVEIYKGKGSHTDPEMYRPISLLSTAYKLFARIIQSRLEAAIDPFLRSTQYGFRCNRSCSQPIHVIRRIMEHAEAVKDPLYLLFLDWEKAFDKIHPQAITTSLARYGVPQDFIRIIAHFYANPQFQVLATGNPSSTHTAHSGIKQGCPLSPYLFLVVHSAIMHDVTHLMTDNGTRQIPTIHSQNTPLFDLAYADDTALIGKSADTVQRALHHIQTTAAQYHLKLNMGKCELIRMNAHSDIYFYDSNPLTPPTTPQQRTKHLKSLTVKVKTQARYLGVYIRQDCSTHTDVNSRLGKARAAFNKLHLFWRHSNLTVPWKLKVYKATFIPMVTYGMESATLTQPQSNKLNAFHCQCLRKILNHKATYYTEVLDPTAHTVTNQAILEEANIPLITDIITSQQLKFLGHILREPKSELTRNVCFTSAYIYRGRGGRQRRGKRRFHWVEQACKTAWQLLQISQPQFVHNPFFSPYTYLQLSRWASHREEWRELVQLPTCMEQSS